MSPTYSPPGPATSRPDAPPGPAADRRTRAAVLGVWALLTLAALMYVTSLGTNLPVGGEWEAVPALTGHETVGVWLWAGPGEPRGPLPRTVFYGLYRLTHDFRAGMVSQVVVLSGLCLVLMLLAARLRGRPHWADAFFPLSLLHTGHGANLLTGSRAGAAITLALVVWLGAVMLRTIRPTAFRSGVVGGVLAAVLCLCGPVGMVVAAAVAVWLVYLAVLVGRTEPAWRAAVLAGLALVPLALAVVQLGHDAFAPDFRAAGETAGWALGPGLGRVWWAVAAGVVLLAVTTLRVLPWDAVGRVGSVGVVALAVGVLVAIGASAGPRDAFLAWPLLGIGFLAWVRHGGRAGKWAPVVLCVAAALAFPGNTGFAIGDGVRFHNTLDQIDAEIRRGTPPEEIAAKHFGDSPHAPAVVRGVPLLRGGER